MSIMKKHDSGWLWPLIGILAIILIAWWALGNAPAAPGARPSGWTAPQQQQGSTSTKGASGGTKTTASDVASVAKGISNASIFASWLASTGVASELTGAGPYTLFVPTDAAIAQLPAGTFRNLSAAEQKRFVEYYVIPGKAVDAEAQVAGTVQTLSGDPLNFTKGAGQATLVGSAVILAQYKSSNGVVYVINNALIPPQKLQ
jgi:uncharacterized surface protein with fasciclin (FAS1) repeats